jgi:hypothetical protein
MFLAFKKRITEHIHTRRASRFFEHCKHRGWCVNAVRLSTNGGHAFPKDQQTLHACGPSWPQRCSSNICKRNNLWIRLVIWKCLRILLYGNRNKKKISWWNYDNEMFLECLLCRLKNVLSTFQSANGQEDAQMRAHAHKHAERICPLYLWLKNVVTNFEGRI